MMLIARDLPDIRKRMAEVMNSDKGAGLIACSLDPTEAVKPEGITDNHRAVSTYAAWSLDHAELFHIQPGMVELLLQACEGIGDAGFMDYDLPTLDGFAYLAGPAPVTHDGREWYELLAVSWSYHAPDSMPDCPHGRVIMNWYLDRDNWLDILDLWEDGAQDSPQTKRKTLGVLPPLIWDGNVEIYCHPDAAGVVTKRLDRGLVLQGSWRERRGDMFRALCYLLRQRVAEESTELPDRAARRRAKREGKEPPAVRVISIRGGSAHGGGDGSREYVHRWIVRGHWRRQWYRSIQAHRPIWITPYVKGPEDAPLLGGEKVYSVATLSE